MTKIYKHRAPWTFMGKLYNRAKKAVSNLREAIRGYNELSSGDFNGDGCVDYIEAIKDTRHELNAAKKCLTNGWIYDLPPNGPIEINFDDLKDLDTSKYSETPK
jgi:hypothetical protein